MIAEPLYSKICKRGTGEKFANASNSVASQSKIYRLCPIEGLQTYLGALRKLSLENLLTICSHDPQETLLHSQTPDPTGDILSLVTME